MSINVIYAESRGFTLIELIVVITILGILAVTALPKFIDMGRDTRIASLNSLAGAVRSGIGLVNAATSIRGIGTPGAQVNITWINIDANTPVRIWSGYPDRWCDGIGMTLSGASVPPGGCYLSTAAIPYGKYTFYGFGNSKISGGFAGWRLEDAPDPRNCSVSYEYAGTSQPIVNVHTSGC